MAAAASLGLATGTKIENWLMAASGATPAQVADIIFRKITFSVLPGHKGGIELAAAALFHIKELPGKGPGDV